MFSTTWTSSERRHRVFRDHAVSIPTSLGFDLSADVFRPDEPGRFPVIMSLAPYPVADQVARIEPAPMRYTNAHLEAGDPRFYVRRGYVHVIGNLPGTGDSGGEFDHMGPDTITAVADAVEWAADQSWSTGNVGMMGMSYYGMVQPLVAARRPRGLRALFCPFAVTDQYRDTYYKGGIFGYSFITGWSVALRHARIRPTLADAVGEAVFSDMVAQARENPELARIPSIMEVLDGADDPVNRFLAELIVTPTLGDHYLPRNVDYDLELDIPAYLGACWGIYGLHLSAAFRSFERWSGPRRMTIGPAAYLDRPISQYQYESLRWFDHWLKGIDTGIVDEAPINLFIENTGKWRRASEWPLPETRFTPFYLHDHGMLFEKEPWRDTEPDRLADSPEERGTLTFRTPPFRETTEVCGPVVANLWASTTGTELLWFLSLLEVDAEGNERLLTRGWLRGSHRRLDPDRSRPWQPVHPHIDPEPLDPGTVTEFNIEIRPLGIEMQPGSRLALRIRTTDEGDDVPNILHDHATGLVAGAQSNVVSIHRDADHPSHLLVPITAGNLIGTFWSGGHLEPLENANLPLVKE